MTVNNYFNLFWYLYTSCCVFVCVCCPLYLCGLSDRSQLQVLRVSPTENLPICGHGQTTVSICGHLLNFNPSQISSDGHWTGGLVVMAQTLKYIPDTLIVREGSHGLSHESPSVVWIHFLEKRL